MIFNDTTLVVVTGPNAEPNLAQYSEIVLHNLGEGTANATVNGAVITLAAGAVMHLNSNAGTFTVTNVSAGMQVVAMA